MYLGTNSRIFEDRYKSFEPRYKSFIPIFKSFVPRYKWFEARYKWFEDRYKWFEDRYKLFVPRSKYLKIGINIWIYDNLALYYKVPRYIFQWILTRTCAASLLFLAPRLGPPTKWRSVPGNPAGQGRPELWWRIVVFRLLQYNGLVETGLSLCLWYEIKN